MRSRGLAASFAVLSAVGCASYRGSLGDFEQKMRGREPAQAAELIRPKAFKEGDDQVVYLLEYGTAQQAAGNYDESTKAFLAAESLTEVKDYHSVTRLTGSLLFNEGLVQYKGDDYEKVMINGMLAINYLMQNKFEDAQVECRKLNDKLYKYRFEGKKKYRQNPFAFYLSALIWEAARDWDTAYIDFKNTHDVNPNIDYLAEDLVRAARNAQRDEDLGTWKKTFPKVTPADLKKVGEVILIYQQGWGPEKRPNPAFPRVPKLYPLTSTTTRARLEVEGGAGEVSQTVLDISDQAAQTLDEQYAGLIAMRLAGIGTKAVVADQIRQKNELLGALTWVGMNLVDRADLRQWSSLPASLQFAKARLAPGKYRVRAVGLDEAGRPTGEQGEWTAVELKAREKKFLNWRSFR